MEEALGILKQARGATTQATRVQALAVKPPPDLEMTPQQFRKFQIDWDVFTKMTNMPSSQANIHLYNCADETVQNAIIDTHPNFFITDPDKLFDMVKVLVTQRLNPIIHRLAFVSMSQDEDEPIKNYLVRHRAVAVDCNFTYPSCEHDLSDIYIKDQIIWGIANNIEITLSHLTSNTAQPSTSTQTKNPRHHPDYFHTTNQV